GGLAHELAVEEEVRREGLDKAALGRDGFAARAARFEDAARAGLAASAASLAVEVDADAAAGAGRDAARAACVAFVRLFEAGAVVEAERVMDVCPRCATVAAGPDALPGEVEGEALVLRLAVLDGDDAVGWVDVRCAAPELVPGVVAVAVPEGHPAAGRTVAVPVAGAVVPVVADPTVAGPALVAPAHDAADLDRARRHGLAPAAVVDATGIVRAGGPLDGLARHAARSAARRLLAAEGAVAGVEPAVEPVRRCAACRSVLVPVLGRHWFLALADLEVAAADLVREGRLAVWPPAARDEMVAIAGGSEDWCLTRQTWAGQRVPVARCGDCRSPDVSVDAAPSCRRCMGELVPEADVLDARFVSCMWPVWRSGWPDGGRRGDDPGGAVLVVPAGRLADVLAMAALGVRLAGEASFAEVVVTPATGAAGGAGGAADVAADAAALVEAEGVGAARAALLCGGLDPGQGRDLVDRLAAVPAGDSDVDRLAEACAAAVDAGQPAAALGLLAAAAARGVPPASAPRLRALAAPFVGG
ncbi:MAG: class I tRNA ligase family protein, partial [Acidimicrobiia bacterium]